METENRDDNLKSIITESNDKVIQKMSDLEKLIRNKSFAYYLKSFVKILSHSNWFLFTISIILLGISICLNISHTIIDGQNIVIGFIGVIATFIVVSNYMQVRDVKAEFERKIQEMESEFNNRIIDQDSKNKNIINNVDEKINKGIEKGIKDIHEEIEKAKSEINYYVSDDFYLSYSLALQAYAIMIFSRPQFKDSYRYDFIHILDLLSDSIYYLKKIKVKPEKESIFMKEGIYYITEVIKAVIELNKDKDELQANKYSISKWEGAIKYIESLNHSTFIQKFIDSFKNKV